MIEDQVTVSTEMHALIPDVVSEEIFASKKNNKVPGYDKGMPILRSTSAPFNSKSSDQIATLLTSLGWQPDRSRKTLDQSGDLGALPYAEAKLISTCLVAYAFRPGKPSISLRGKQIEAYP